MCEILSVCVSSTICVYRTAKWFKPFVRVHSKPKSCDSTCAKLRGVRAFSTTTKTVIKIMLILTPHAGFILTLSKVRPSQQRVRALRGRPQLGWGWTATVLRFQMLLLHDLRHLPLFVCGNHLPTQPICSFVCPPTCGQSCPPNRRHSIISYPFII
jgi:hypothetical protein